MKPREVTSVHTLMGAINKEYCIVYCTTAWSVPCRNQYPALVQMAENYSGWKTIVQIDIEKYPDVASELNIQSIPTILLFYRGKEVRRLVGLKSFETLYTAVDTMLPKGWMTCDDRKEETHSQNR